VKQLNLTHLPVVASDISCLDVLRFFRSGKSEMVMVTDCGTSNGRAVGILPHSDIIEILMR